MKKGILTGRHTQGTKMRLKFLSFIREANKKNIWFDQKEIVWGDNVIADAGLSESFMGIVVLSNNFFDRTMTELELNSMILLMNALRFRILPLYYDMDHHALLERYPLLAGIRGEKADRVFFRLLRI